MEWLPDYSLLSKLNNLLSLTQEFCELYIQKRRVIWLLIFFDEVR